MIAADPALPQVAFWRVVGLRFFFALIALALSSFVWEQLLFDSADWPAMTGIAKAMMASLVILCLLGIRYPLDLLPVMLFELLWKLIWLAVIALPAWVQDRWTESIGSAFLEIAPVFVLLFIIPWNYVWARWFKRPSEPWRPQHG